MHIPTVLPFGRDELSMFTREGGDGREGSEEAGLEGQVVLS